MKDQNSVIPVIPGFRPSIIGSTSGFCTNRSVTIPLNQEAGPARLVKRYIIYLDAIIELVQTQVSKSAESNQ
ncbi:hypothetical protein HI914_03602 [Erysiphe necator]|nr:hypothetical protein HI914_03602 [Erysiphe necator]